MPHISAWANAGIWPPVFALLGYLGNKWRTKRAMLTAKIDALVDQLKQHIEDDKELKDYLLGTPSRGGFPRVMGVLDRLDKGQVEILRRLPNE